MRAHAVLSVLVVFFDLVYCFLSLSFGIAARRSG
jgi:hypothetical protein